MPPVPRLAGPRVRLDLADEDDTPGLLSFHQRNAERFRPWLPEPPGDFLTLGHWLDWTRRAQALFRQDQAVWLVLRGRERGPERTGAAAGVLGQINFSGIQRGPLLCCSVGVQIDAAAEGRGLMREAMELALGYVFGPLGLRRVTAGYLPENRRSAALFARLGFHEEGVARESLLVGGAWRDQVMVARLAGRGRRPPPAGRESGGDG